MKIVKFFSGVLLLGILVVAFQLVDLPKDSPGTRFQQLPDASLLKVAEAEKAAGQLTDALLVLDYAIENDCPDKEATATLRQQIFAQVTADQTPVGKLQALGWTASVGAGNSFASLAGLTVADAALYGEIADLVRQPGFAGVPDAFTIALSRVSGIINVFPPATGALTLAQAARRTGAFDDKLTGQLQQILDLVMPDPKAVLAVEKFKENFMPLFELARRCRTWAEFSTILQQADSPDQIKVLTKMVSVTPGAAKRLSQVLTLAARDGRTTPAQCLDHVLKHGPKGLDALYAAAGKGLAGLKFAMANPSFVPQNAPRVTATGSVAERLQRKYQTLHAHHGPMIPAAKYLAIAICAGLLVLLVVPGRYLEKLLTRGSPGEAGPVHFFLSALAVGAVLSGLAYLLSVAVQPLPEPVAMAEAGTAAAATAKADNALLSGVVVLLSLAIHAVVWFYVRSKVRAVEDDETANGELRMRQLENLDVFLDLPLFTGLALTVIAFILITLDAGMSRHFAYTSTVVGILSAVSLRIRYVYPLKERLIRSR